MPGVRTAAKRAGDTEGTLALSPPSEARMLLKAAGEGEGTTQLLTLQAQREMCLCTF